MFYIYILFSKAINKFYVGHSIDPWKRIIQHNNNTADKFTGKTKDWELMAVFEVSEKRADAMELEKFIKNQKSRKLIELLVHSQNNFEGKLAQLVIPYVRDACAELITRSPVRTGSGSLKKAKALHVCSAFFMIKIIYNHLSFLNFFTTFIH